MDWHNIEITDSEDNIPEQKQDKVAFLAGLSANPELLHEDILKKATHLDAALDQHDRMLETIGSNPESHYSQIAQKLDVDDFTKEMNGIILDSGIKLPLLGCNKDDVSLELGSMEDIKIVRMRINITTLESETDLQDYTYFERAFALPKGTSEMQAFWNTGQLEIFYL